MWLGSECFRYEKKGGVLLKEVRFPVCSREKDFLENVYSAAIGMAKYV